ncbi:hypothetical protein AJ80_03634 [Polytolypa hystricis UAMH7299]|uniref:RNA polymerase II holoenzyme cyclin-like subunit n=1 Tax=Polytolypa hystricis (strain UAMH7299) TaxID=1447883 RepID=A0A2B7YFR8_POLH7|nr:hypothetical protein AJ80_03634 [Polytolypa hystricis UAMH7299]
MLEDEIYRTSTQYRLWSFTPASLTSVRENTNAVAAERVRAAIRRAREEKRAKDGQQQQAISGSGAPNAGSGGGGGSGGEKDIECLTVEEELELVRYYCEKLMELADTYQPPIPTAVRATAIQYLRRFYLTNSPMSYHPKSIMSSALFLATKTDNYYMSLRSFVEKIPNCTSEDVLAPEFLLTQGLRFTFDVRHPFPGLEGGIMELNAIAQGSGAAGPHFPHHSPADLQRGIQALPPPPPSSSSTTDGSGAAKPISPTTRLAKAHHTTREILKTAAQLTDTYFLHTPAQIWLAALTLADKPLADFYLDVKLGLFPPTTTNPPPPPSSSSPSTIQGPTPQQALKILRSKLSTVLTSCATLLQTYQTTQHTPESDTQAKMKNLKRIGKKLYHCQNPEKLDLVGLNRAQKREGSAAGTATPVGGGGGDGATPVVASSTTGAGGGGGEAAGAGEEAELLRVAKKRKLEREKWKRETKGLFGGELVKEKGTKGGDVGE